jgi:hypothetical protein
MTDIASLLSIIWGLMTGFNIPIINVTPGALLITVIVVQLSLFILVKLMGIGVGTFPIKRDSSVPPKHWSGSFTIFSGKGKHVK